jgi:glucose-6-phosphate-specific signal transduction histidine kinase
MAELNPPLLEFGLPMGLRWLAEKFLTYKLEVKTHIPDGVVLKLSENQIGLLFQSVRELLMNVVKHAQVDRAQVFLRLQENMLHLEVVDQGKGCDLAGSLTPQSSQRSMEKFGLFSIRERMEALGGRFEFHSSLNQGTRASLLLPLEHGQDNQLSLTHDRIIGPKVRTLKHKHFSELTTGENLLLRLSPLLARLTLLLGLGVLLAAVLMVRPSG